MPYALTNVGGKWWAEGELDSGRKVRFECGEGSKDAAEAVAAMRWERRLQSAAASRKRWDARDAGAAAAAAPSSARASSPERNAAIRGRLLALGDASELPGDDDDGDDDDAGDDDDGDDEATVHPSLDDAKEADDDDEEEGEDDEEAAEVLADVIGNGIYSGVTGTVTKVLKRAKPPREPGEPHELFVRYGREGCCYRIRKLIGKGAKLSPNGKLLVGLAGTIITMIWNSEVIEEGAPPVERKPTPAPAPKPAAAAAPAPSSPAAPPHANGVAKEDKPARLALVRTDQPDSPPDDPLGSFS